MLGLAQDPPQLFSKVHAKDLSYTLLNEAAVNQRKLITITDIQKRAVTHPYETAKMLQSC